MAQLTDEQVKMAAQAMYGAYTRTAGAPPDHPEIWKYMPETVRGIWREAARAAAPYMQMPLDEPTDLDIHQAAMDKFGFVQNIDMLVARDICIHFVRRGNTSLLSKLVDPRIAAIKEVLNSKYLRCNTDELAREILTALDGKP